MKKGPPIASESERGNTASAEEMGTQGERPTLDFWMPTARYYASANSNGNAPGFQATAHRPSFKIYKALGDKTNTSWERMRTSDKAQSPGAPESLGETAQIISTIHDDLSAWDGSQCTPVVRVDAEGRVRWHANTTRRQGGQAMFVVPVKDGAGGSLTCVLSRSALLQSHIRHPYLRRIHPRSSSAW